MDCPPLYAVDFSFALSRLEQERDFRKSQRIWANTIIAAATITYLTVGTSYLSADHFALALLNIVTVWMLWDRMNKLHIKYIADQINLLICVERKNEVRNPANAPADGYTHNTPDHELQSA